MVVVDSLVEDLGREEFSSKKDNVKVITQQGSTTEDLLNYIKPIARRKPDTSIIHTGTNTLLMVLTQWRNVRKLVEVVSRIEESEEISIDFSSVIYRKDKYLKDELNEANMKLKKFYKVKDSFLLKMPTSINWTWIILNCIKIKSEQIFLPKTLKGHLISFEALIHAHMKLRSLTLIWLKITILTMF